MTRVGIGGERGPGGAESGGQGAQVAVALAGAEQRPGGWRGGRRAGHGEGTGRPGAAFQRAFRAVGRSLMSLSEKGSCLRIFEQEDDMIRRLTQRDGGACSRLLCAPGELRTVGKTETTHNVS